MSPKQIELVQHSWLSVHPIADTAAQLFYNRLFEVDPSLRALFKRDLKSQGRLLMRMIDVAVSSLSRLETIVPTLQALGRRHAGYGVTDAHYETVAGALMWTLERGLGEAFVPAGAGGLDLCIFGASADHADGGARERASREVCRLTDPTRRTMSCDCISG